MAIQAVSRMAGNNDSTARNQFFFLIDKDLLYQKQRRKGRDHKKAMVESIRQAVENYNSVFVFTVDNMRNLKFKELREQLKSTSRCLKMLLKSEVGFSFQLFRDTSNYYRKYGTWVARNPTLVLISSLAIVLLLCIGLLRFKVETRPDKLWVGPGSKASQEKEFFDSHLAPFYRIEQIIIATIPDSVHGKPPSILNDNNVKLLFDIQKKIDGIRANYSGRSISLSDICMKPLDQECATQSVLQYFQMNPENVDNYGGVDHLEYCFQHYSSADSCRSAFEAPLDPSTALGGFSGNNYSEASAFLITYPVNNAINKEGNESGPAVAWEKAFIQLAKVELLTMTQSQNLTLSFSSKSSIEEELKRESTADVITILISYLVMFAYISLTLGDRPHLSTFYVSSKVLLGLSGVVLVMLSVLASVGFFSAIGVKSTLIIMEVIPFLVLAVGVDNMCILVHAVKRQSVELPLEGRISNALVEVGPSITLASLSEVLAFAVGSFIPMPACRVFSMFAALAVLLDFLLQVTAFVALIVFDFLRTEDKRVDCFPCIKSSRYVGSDKVWLLVMLVFRSQEIKLEWGKGLAKNREAEAELMELELEKDRPSARSRSWVTLSWNLCKKVREAQVDYDPNLK